MQIAVLIVGCIYFLFLIILFSGWRASWKSIDFPSPDFAFITVVIAARNEEKNITSVLSDLNAQTYEHFEVIVVDDESQDHTMELARKSEPLVRVVKNNGAGKKQALTTGIQLAKGDIIVTTDADCTIPRGWLTSINNAFDDPELKMLTGPVTISARNNFFTALQQIELASLIGSGASALTSGFPIMCNGANLAFRTSVFHEVNGYDGNFHIASGDDEFLMRKIKVRYPKGIKFLGDERAIIQTQPLADLGQFFQQRLRWASKWKFNSSASAVTTAFFVIAIQIATFYCLFEVVTSQAVPCLAFLFLKLGMEAWLLRDYCRFLKVPWSWLAFVFWQLVYPFYTLTVGLISTFSGYRWKGRNY